MRIVAVTEGSQAEKKGIRTGDKIVAIDGVLVRDHLDLMYYASEESFVLTLHRGTYEFMAQIDNTLDYGFELEPMAYRRCGNNCVFCFIDQNPPGMRKEIGFKDEDYRLSFIDGSYVTMANLTESDMERIVAQHLSPLYVSIHAVDPAVRRFLLGLKKEDNLLDKLDRLTYAGIVFHTQIVVCPGINDGDVLKETILALRKRYPGVSSVAVVPVGLTAHRENLYPLTAVDALCAEKTISIVDSLHNQFADETDDGFVYCSDEWYLKAGREVPPESYYDHFPQIENGVGMVRDFLDASKDIESKIADAGRYRQGRFVFVTGVSMGPYIGDLAQRISTIPGIEARSLTVVNEFFGASVTVSGLLTGRDITKNLSGIEADEIVVLPPNCLNGDGVFLDDMKPSEMAGQLGVQVLQAEYDPAALFLL